MTDNRTSHTPGPWKVREIAFEDMARRAFVVETAERRIANVSNAKGGIASDLYGVEQPNARLIAAAPELLAACKYVLERNIRDSGVIEMCREAVTKAEWSSI